MGDVRINLKPLLQLEKIPRKVFKQWAIRYRSFVRERFVKFSRGGGNWKPLKRKRRRGELKRAAILRDTGTLFASLDVQFRGKPGQLQESLPNGIRVGFGGPAKHPKAGITVAGLAAVHHFGLGRVPARPIIVDPSSKVIKQMAGDVERDWIKRGK